MLYRSIAALVFASAAVVDGLAMTPRAGAPKMCSPNVASPPEVATGTSVGQDMVGKVMPTNSDLLDRTAKTDKEKVVVLGSGWGAVKCVQNLDTTKMDVTVISPRNFFLFTPFLPSVTVGTVESRTVVESMRSLLQYDARPIDRKLKDKFNEIDAENFVVPRFIEAACSQIVSEENRLICDETDGLGGHVNTGSFSISYDKLIVAVGGKVDTFNTPGVREHAVFLKEIEDAMNIRGKVLHCFESAALVDDPVEKKKRVSFVVVGAGPTGLEFAAELSDSIKEDFSTLYPEETKVCEVTLVSSSNLLLASYDKRVSEFTNELMAQSDVVLKTGCRVTEVKEGGVMVRDKQTKEVEELPAAVTLWSTGVAPIDVVKDFIDAVPEQTKRHGIYVDRDLRAFGTTNVYAMGDCASVASNGKLMIDDLKRTYEEAACAPAGMDADACNVLSKADVMQLMDESFKKFPKTKDFSMADDYKESISGILDRDLQEDMVDQQDFRRAIDDCYSGLRSLPPTAQVASQQGSYLASYLNGETTENFKYFHKGSMAYVGQNKAAAQVSMLKNFLPEFMQNLPIVGEDIVLTGSLAELVWKGLYLDMQISNRNKFQVAFDWAKASMFGRDASRY